MTTTALLDYYIERDFVTGPTRQVCIMTFYAPRNRARRTETSIQVDASLLRLLLCPVPINSASSSGFQRSTTSTNARSAQG